jgi:putative endopeptidase
MAVIRSAAEENPMHKHTLVTVLAAGALLLSACPSGGGKTGPAPTPTPVTPEPGSTPGAEGPMVKQTSLAKAGIDPQNLDKTVDPCEDFYQFACGGWLDKTEIPADRAGYGTFNVLADQSEKLQLAILDKAAKDPGDSPSAQRLGAFYGACMDEAAVEAAGLSPFQPTLKRIDGLKDQKAVAALVVDLHKMGVYPFFAVDGERDLKDVTKMVAWIDQSGMGLPDKDFYLVDDANMKKIRGEYVSHIERMLALSGLPAKVAKQGAADVMDIETSMAKLSLGKLERRDPEKLYNKIATADLAKQVPGFDWLGYFKAMGIVPGEYVLVTSPAYAKGVVELMGKVPLAKWKTYLRWSVLDAAAANLSKAFVDESFKMTQVLLGQPELPPRWKRCVRLTDALLGDDLGQEYVKTAFSAAAKQNADALMLAIKAAFAQNLAAVDWMDDATRQAARQKLDMMVYKIGYPVKWKQYDFAVKKDSHAQNVLAAEVWAAAWRLGRIGKPVDRDEWQMTPATVNAYYNPLNNEMVFPAAILQPPFYSAEAATWVNAGAIGMVMGHELTHGFDDEGSKFAGDGNLKVWWPDGPRQAFEQRTQCVVDKYSKYEPLPGEALNGKLTLGENIADLGGMKIAFAAHRAARAGAAEVYEGDGFSEDQMFFLAAGQAWCSKRREADERQRLTTDPHSAPRFRVNGSLSNMPEFHQAFGCKAGQKMVPAAEKVCRVW